MRHRKARDMSNITDCAQSIKPIAIRAYIDKIQVWLERALTAQCGHGGLHEEEAQDEAAHATKQ
jgi:hypothetical protein